MAFIHIRSVSKKSEKDLNWGRGLADYLITSSRMSTSGEHRWTSDPVEADIILFAERRDEGPYYEFVRRDRCYQKFHEKCLVFSTTDFPTPLLPGIYPSIPRQFHDPRRTCSGFFIADIDVSRYAAAPERPQWLASFVGSAFTDPVRQRIMELNHHAFLLQDTEGLCKIAERDGNTNTMEHYRALFVRHALNSKFILCPRGFGSSSIRLFEVMKMGRAPVIISDDWVEPSGPDWQSFSLRVKERDVSHLPEILREHENQAPELGRRAKLAFERWFSIQSSFDTVANWCVELHASRRRVVWPKVSFLFNRFHLKHYVRTRISLLKSKRRLYL
jgi:hypothetical protein